MKFESGKGMLQVLFDEAFEEMSDTSEYARCNIVTTAITLTDNSNLNDITFMTNGLRVKNYYIDLFEGMKFF